MVENNLLSPKVRFVIYVLTGLITPVITVLTLPEVHILPSYIGIIWAAEVTFVGGLAASNTPTSK